MKLFHGKSIYQPAGKAAEYSSWAVNFYNGCSARCEYCYNRHGRSAKIVGGDFPTLKKSLVDEKTARTIFIKEVDKNINELQKHGLFFNFVSDPCLKETIELNFGAIHYCRNRRIPVKLLTKQIWWVNNFIHSFPSDLYGNISIGFTLTGFDKLEPGAATNKERILAGRKLSEAGFKVWFSIEPIIDFDTSFQMIDNSIEFAQLYKIGLKSGLSPDKYTVKNFISDVLILTKSRQVPVYFKDSLLKTAGLDRKELTFNCVTSDYNL
jgi:DNA repair photolyase